MSNDSVLVLYRESPFAYDDAVSYHLPYQSSPYADTVPVFLVPYLGIRRPDGRILLHQVAGYAAWDPTDILASSVWLASNDILLAGAAATLAHELGHLLLPYSLFPDRATDFVNIMDYPDSTLKYRRPPAGFGLELEQVHTNTLNVRQLIEVEAANAFVHNQCRLALTPAANVLELSNEDPSP